jgi:DNA-directed RNA polymerase specialized sigma24 family protein
LAAIGSTTSFHAGADALTTAIASDEYHRYLEGLARVTPLDRVLVIARMELGYSDQQIALVMHAESADAARVAVSGALLRLSREMSHA